MARTQESIIERVVECTTRMPLREWNWSEGVALYGLVTLWKRRGGDDVVRFVEAWIDRQLAEGGVHENVNATAPCFAMLELYERGGRQDARYAEAIASRVEFFLHRAERLRNGAYEHTLAETTFGGQMWVDTLFMAGLFLVRAGLLLDVPDAVDEGLRQYRLHAERLQQDNGLFYHAWDEGSGAVKGCQWARGNAWAAIVSVELLSMLPEGRAERPFIAATLHRLLEGLKRTQDVSGLWSTVLTEPDTYLETSAAAGIAYAAAKGIRTGVVDAGFARMGDAAGRAALAYVDGNGAFLGVSAGTGVQNHPGEYHVIAQGRLEGYGQGILLMLLSEELTPVYP